MPFMGRNSLFVCSVLAFLLAFLLLDRFSLEAFYSRLQSDEIVDLARTLIQTIGILASLVTVSGIFYIGKVGKLAQTFFSEATKSTSRITECLIALRNVDKWAEEISSEVADRCKKCGIARTCQVREYFHQEMIKRTEGMMDHMKQVEMDVIKLKGSPERMDASLRRSEYVVTTGWVSAICVLFLSIILSIMAYLTTNAAYLQWSIESLVAGMSALLIAWAISHSVFRTDQNLFHHFLAVYGQIDSYTLEANFLKTQFRQSFDEIIREGKCKFTKLQD